MTNLQMIEALCHLIEEETKLLLTLAARLEEIDTVTDAEKEAVEAVRKKYTQFLGHDEAPDFLDLE